MTINIVRGFQAASLGTLALTGLSGLTSAAEIRVPADHPTIQAAVNAANTNDSIHIAAGVYTGQVEITNGILTLIGQPGTILRATTNMTSHAGGVNIPIMEIRSSQVTVRGLTFEGERLAERFVGPGDLLGIYLRSSSGIVENCAFYGFRESAPGSENAHAILIAAIGDGEVNVRVAGCTFADNYGAILSWGLPDRRYINLTNENNIIIGPGPLTGDNNYAGIQIGEGVGGRIAGNTISGYSYVGTTAAFPISFGILAVNAANYPPSFGNLLPLIIEGNTLRDNQWHIALVKGDNSVVKDNRFQGTAPGVLPLGLAVSGTNVTIAENLFEDMPEGIRLLGDDPDFGTILGSAVNAQVTGNRFSDVALPINRQSMATATEQGNVTVTGPFPPPFLGITPAVLLTWAGIEEGYVVEAAPTLNGPWTLAEATPFMQDGQQSLSVPAGEGSRFFRLRKP